MIVPFVDLAAPNREVWPEASRRIEALVRRGEFVLGEEVAEFERAFAERCGTRYAVGVSSGTSALVLILRALGLGPGDEVVTVSNTFVATVAAIALAGARAVLVDVDEHESMDPAALRAAIGPRTRAILPVHLRGRPAPMRDLMAVADEAGVPLIEDCSQATGAHIGGRPVGSSGVAGCFSLHPLKNLAAAGDAGVIVTDDERLEDALRLLRNHGLRGRDAVERWGDNARLAPMQAAVLNAKLPHLERWNATRRALAGRYRDRLAGVPIEMPADHPGHVYHHFVVRTDRREELVCALWEAGVDTRVHYPVPVHCQPAAQVACRVAGALPRTERDAGRILSLPLHPHLAAESVDTVADVMRTVLGDG